MNFCTRRGDVSLFWRQVKVCFRHAVELALGVSRFTGPTSASCFGAPILPSGCALLSQVYTQWLLCADFLPSCPVHRQWLEFGMVLSSLTRSTAEVNLFGNLFNSFFPWFGHRNWTFLLWEQDLGFVRFAAGTRTVAATIKKKVKICLFWWRVFLLRSLHLAAQRLSNSGEANKSAWLWLWTAWRKTKW